MGGPGRQGVHGRLDRSRDSGSHGEDGDHRERGRPRGHRGGDRRIPCRSDSARPAGALVCGARWAGHADGDRGGPEGEGRGAPSIRWASDDTRVAAAGPRGRPTTIPLPWSGTGSRARAGRPAARPAADSFTPPPTPTPARADAPAVPCMPRTSPAARRGGRSGPCADPPRSPACPVRARPVTHRVRVAPRPAPIDTKNTRVYRVGPYR